MKIFDYTLKQDPFPHNKFMREIQKSNFCFLDIETTGFSRKRDQVVLIGLLFSEGHEYKLRQYFLEDSFQEKKLLTTFIKDLSEFDLMITYNGLSFDYPFIQHRAKNYQLPLQLNNLKHIDLYKHIQKHKNRLPIENFQLKTIEKLLGICRKDGISGGESADLYGKYTKNKDVTIRDRILLHNYEDIFYLPSITGIFSFFSDNIDLVNSLHHSVHLTGSENNKHQRLKELTFVIKFKDIRIKDHKLLLQGNTNALGDFQKINIFKEHFNFHWSPDEEMYKLDLLLDSELLDSHTRVHYFNYKKTLTSFERLAHAHDSKRNQVNNNIIMSINRSINYNNALEILPVIIKKIFQEYLSAS